LVNDVSGQPIGHLFKGEAVLEGGPTGYSETSVDYQYTLSKISEERRSLSCKLLK